MSRKATVGVSRSFEASLERIETFLDESALFDQLVADLTDRVVPLLERLPLLGPPFVPTGLSGEGRLLLETIAHRLKTREIRQLVRGDFLLLYAVAPGKVTLLSVRHHRELGFHFVR